ncbi:MAG: hypothetical protein IJW59_04000 [Clostridia bacterium]|nr:hypothetical protein [Clostridia bacterium]
MNQAQKTTQENRDLAQRIYTKFPSFKTNKDGLVNIYSFINAIEELRHNTVMYVAKKELHDCLIKDSKLYDILLNLHKQWSANHHIDTKISFELGRQLYDDPTEAKFGDEHHLVIDQTNPKAQQFEKELTQTLNFAIDINKNPEIAQIVKNSIEKEYQRQRRIEEADTISENSRFGGQN